MTDPKCGACGRPKSEHFGEGKVYCNLVTNGDVYTSEPDDAAIMDYMRRRTPSVIRAISHLWRVENGHEEAE